MHRKETGGEDEKEAAVALAAPECQVLGGGSEGRRKQTGCAVGVARTWPRAGPVPISLRTCRFASREK